MSTLNSRPNPYVGPRAFQTGEKLYGRDHEVRELLDLLIAERIILLHSPSGAGKSSLVQAGLIPALKGEGFQVLPPMRVNQELPTAIPEDQRGNLNRYRTSVLLSLAALNPGDIPLEQLVSLSLDEYLERIHKPGEQEQTDKGESLVLIFDQFEEILTADATDREAKHAFFTHLGQALRRRNRWALFVMREDYLAALDPYLRPIPTRLANTYRLDFLGVNAAHQAIQQPVREHGVEFTTAAVGKLVDDLRLVQVQQADSTIEVRLGPYVEPVQLQVVCHHLWEQLPLHKKEITADDISGIGNVDQSLAEYYAQQVAEIAIRAEVKERRIRDWFEHQLITEGGLRGQVRKQPDEKSQLENRAIRMLEDAHLIRAEKRLGATWFELAHDRLIQPVRMNNSAWFQHNLSLLQRQASLWEQQNRSDTLYLRDLALVEAEAWANENRQEMSPTDRAFLEACLEVRVREEEARLAAERERQMKIEAAQKVADAERLRAEEQTQTAFKLRRRAYILGGVLAIAMIMAGLAVLGGVMARNNAARAQENAVKAQIARDEANANASIAKANEAEAQKNEARAQAARDEANANAAMAKENEIRAQAARDEANTNAAMAEANAKKAVEKEAEADKQSTLAYSSRLALQSMSLLKTQPDMAALMSIGAYRIADTWEAKKALLNSIPTGQQPLIPFGQPLPIQSNSVDSVAISPDGERIAWGTADGEIVIWDYRDNVESQRYKIHQGRVKSLDFSPTDGELLVSGGEFDGQIVLWDVINQTELTTYLPETNISSVRSLAFHPDYPDTSYVAAAIGSQVIFLEVKQEDGEINLVPINFGSPNIRGAIYSVEWSPDGKWLAAASADTSVYVWNPFDNNIPTNHRFDNHQSIVRSIAWSPDSMLLASADEGGEIYLWKRDSKTLEAPGPMKANTQVYTLAFSTDGQYLASGGQDNKIVLWDTNGEKVDETSPHSWMIVDLDFSPIEGEYLLASASYDRSIGLHEILKPQPLNTHKATIAVGPLISLALEDNDTFWLANAVEDINTVQVQDYSLQESKTLNQLPVISIPVTPTSLTLSPDGTHLTIAGFDGGEANEENGNIHTYHLESGEPVRSISEDEEGKPLDGYIYSLAYSPEGSKLASSHCAKALLKWDEKLQCAVNEIRIWDTTTGEIQKITIDHTDFIYALAFSPDGNLIASGSEDKTIRISDLDNPDAEEMVLTGHTDRVISLAFSPDGYTLASSSQDKTLMLWDIDTRQPIGELIGESSGENQPAIISLIYSPNGQLLYSVDSQGALYEWDVNIESWIERACERARPILSDEEWELYFPQMDFRNAKPGEKTACEILSATHTPTPTPSGTPTPSSSP